MGPKERVSASREAEEMSVASSSHASASHEASETKEITEKHHTISRTSSHDSIATGHEEEDQDGPVPPANLARTISIIPDAVIVDRSRRRGLFSRFALIPEVENPHHYERKTKWFLTSIVAFCAMAAPMGSAIVMPVLQDIAIDFNASPVTANMSVAVYMLAMSIFPLWWSSFSETGGRRSIYIVSFSLFVVFAVLSAISTNIAMLVVFRTFTGGASASVQAVGAGTIADMWEMRERGKAMGFFYLGPLIGPLLGPLFGGILGQSLGWRSTQWFLVIYGAITVLLIVFALPETLPPKEAPVTTSNLQSPRGDLTRVSTRQSVQQKTKSYMSFLRRIFVDPLYVITWMRYPPVALTVYYAGITFGSLYVLNISIQSTFSRQPYNFSTLILGLLYLPSSLGYFLASVFGGRWIDKIMHREAKKAGRYDEKGKLILRPEDRMRENAWIAAILWPGALIWYGWTAEKGVFWVAPMIANFFFGVGSMMIFGLSATMLTEFMPKRASAGIAINNFFRNLLSFTGAMVADPVLGAIGNGWLFTILGLWALFSGVLVISAMRKFGPGWRDKMVEALG